MKYIILNDVFANKLNKYNGAIVDYRDLYTVYGVNTDAFIARNLNKLVKEVNKKTETKKESTVEVEKNEPVSKDKNKQKNKD